MDRGTLARLDGRRAALHHAGNGAAPLSRRAGAVDVRAGGMDDGHVRLRGPHPGGAVAGSPLARRAASGHRAPHFLFSIVPPSPHRPSKRRSQAPASSAQTPPGSVGEGVRVMLVRRSGRRDPGTGPRGDPGDLSIARESTAARTGGARATARSADLARQLTTAQLSALTMQLQPHFLQHARRHHGADPATATPGRGHGCAARRSAQIRSTTSRRRRCRSGGAGIPALVSVDRAGSVRGSASRTDCRGSRPSDARSSHGAAADCREWCGTASVRAKRQ